MRFLKESIVTSNNMFFPHKEQPRTQFYNTIAMSFIVISLILVAAVFYVTFSWATIILTQEKQISQRTITIQVADTTNNEQGVLQGKVLTEEMDAQGTFTPEESSSLIQKAQGIITVVNSTSKKQPLRETTRLLSSDTILFRTTEYVVVPAKGSVRVPVIADEEGDVGSSLSNARFTLPGLWPGLQTSIYGQGFEISSGGLKRVYTLSQNDIERASHELDVQLQEKFSTVSQSQLAVKPQSLKSIISSKVLSGSSDKPLGSTTDSFTYAIKEQLTGIFFDEYAAKAYIEEVLKKELSSGYQLVPLDMNSLEYSLEDIDRPRSKATLSVRLLAGQMKSTEYLSLEKRSLTGKSINQVVSYFQDMPSIKNVHVRFYPFWVTRTPLLHDHINIIVENEDQQQ